MADLSGQSLGRYHILEPLGGGGMAIVYKAFDTRLETDVAVKVIRTERLTEETKERAMKRFEREAKALARLTHPNIVKVMDYGEYEGKPYLVMPYLPGGTLKQTMGKLISWQESVHLLIPIVEALGYAHSQNMIHRDVKPSNVLLTHSGQPMLTDFGIAKILDLEDTQDLTGTSAAVGTPEYMAPEQSIAKNVDHRVDIYALGVVFYEMVTGRKPYTADTPMAVLIMHARDPLPSPKKFVPNLPDSVEKILLKAMAKEPEYRFQNMNEVASGIKAILMEQNRTSETVAEKVAEQAIREKAALEARQKAELERKENSEREKIKRESAEQARQKKIEGQVANRAERQARITKTNIILKTVISKTLPFMKIGGVIAFILLLLWAGTQILPNFLMPVPTEIIAITPSPIATSVPVFTSKPLSSPTQTTVPPTLTQPRELSLETIASIQELRRIGSGQFNALDWSLDGEYFAVASSIGFYLYGSATGEEILFARTDSSVEKISLSLESNLVALITLAKNSEVQIWDLTSQKLVQTIPTDHQVDILDFSPSGTTLITSWLEYDNNNGEVHIWNPASGLELQVLPTAAESISFSSNGRSIATAGAEFNNQIQIWNVETGQLQRSIPTGAYRNYDSNPGVLFHPNQQKITWVETIREKNTDPNPCGCVINYKYVDMRRFFDLDNSSIYLSASGDPMAYSPDGGKVVSLNRDILSKRTSLRVMQADDLSEMTSFVLTDQLIGYMISEDGLSIRVLSYGGQRNVVKLSSINIASGEISLVREIDFAEYGILELAAIRGSDLLALDSNGLVSIFSSKSGEYKNSFKSNSKGIFLSILPYDDDTLMAGLSNGTIEFWDADNWTLQKTISERQNGQVKTLGLNTSKNLLAASGYTTLEAGTAKIIGGRTLLWDIKTGELVDSMSHKNIVTDILFSLDENHILGGAKYPDFNIYDWDPATGRQQGSMNYRIPGFPKDPIIVTMALNPDNYTLALGFAGEPYWKNGEFILNPTGPLEIQIWDLQTYSLVKTLPGHSLSIQSLEFSSDGKMLVSGSTDGTIKVWDIKTSELLTTLSGHGEAVTDLLFDPDGFHFYSASQDGTVITWGDP